LKSLTQDYCWNGSCLFIVRHITMACMKCKASILYVLILRNSLFAVYSSDFRVRIFLFRIRKVSGDVWRMKK
jgi:hypothetical protein